MLDRNDLTRKDTLQRIDVLLDITLKRDHTDFHICLIDNAFKVKTFLSGQREA
jgi:hypothetical protein